LGIKMGTWRHFWGFERTAKGKAKDRDIEGKNRTQEVHVPKRRCELPERPEGLGRSTPSMRNRGKRRKGTPLLGEESMNLSSRGGDRRMAGGRGLTTFQEGAAGEGKKRS